MIPTSEPSTIQAGDTTTWTRAIPDYPASAGWVLHYTLTQAGKQPITVDGSASGDLHGISIPAATTAGWGLGTWHWLGYVTKGAERYTVAKGTVEVLVDPASVPAGYDPRTHAEKAVAAIEAVLEGNLTGSLAEYEINGRKAKLWSHAELVKLRAIYRAQVRRERGGASMTPIPMRLKRV